MVLQLGSVGSLGVSVGGVWSGKREGCEMGNVDGWGAVCVGEVVRENYGGGK